MIEIKTKILEHGKNLELPSYATVGSAGVDLRAAINESVVIRFGERVLIPSGIVIAIPDGFEGQIRSRSGLSYKHGIAVLNSPGTIDSDYRGELKILLINFGKEDFIVERGLRVAQLIINRYEKVSYIEESDMLNETSRADGGYGSTGMV